MLFIYLSCVQGAKGGVGGAITHNSDFLSYHASRKNKTRILSTLTSIQL